MALTRRDTTFDIVRALCAIEVVAFWHLSNYLPPKYAFGPQLLHWGEIMTWGCLACFTFMSGYFLQKYTIYNWKDVLMFYKKRFLRFYILYSIAACSLFLGGIIINQPFFTDTIQFILTLVGLGCFHMPSPPTLWYFCMMIFFYLITPIILMSRKSANKLLVSLILYLFLWICHIIWGIDHRMIVYFPFYILGITLRKEHVEYLKNWKLLIIIFPIWLILVLLIDKWTIYQGTILDLFFIIFLISLASLINKCSKLTNLLSFISYGSMIAYLFHRHFYLSAVVLCNLNQLSNLRNAHIPLPVALLLVIPLIFILSYYIQKIYDLIIKRITHVKT